MLYMTLTKIARVSSLYKCSYVILITWTCLSIHDGTAKCGIMYKSTPERMFNERNVLSELIMGLKGKNIAEVLTLQVLICNLNYVDMMMGQPHVQEYA